MPTLDHLPTAEDGFAGLWQLVDLFGAEETYKFISWVRDQSQQDDAAQVRGVIAAELIDAAVGEGSDYDDARRDVAGELGYTALTRTNFYKVEKLGREYLAAGHRAA